MAEAAALMDVGERTVRRAKVVLDRGVRFRPRSNTPIWCPTASSQPITSSEFATRIAEEIKVAREMEKAK